MNKLALFLIAFALAGVSGLNATDYTIFIHGRGKNNCGTSTTDVNNYWGNAKNINTSTTKYFVGYDGASDPRTWGSCRAQTQLYTVLEAQCKGTNHCKVICHSAGCYAIEYFLDNTTATYNIDFVMASSSAAGGSELANIGASDGMTTALKTANARGSYNHNDMKGIGIWAVAGYKGSTGSFLLPGDDDGAVSLHSTCGHTVTGSHTACNQTRFTSHYIWDGSFNNNNGWNATKKAYNRTHVGDGSSSINDAARLEYNDCKSPGVNGFVCQ